MENGGETIGAGTFSHDNVNFDLLSNRPFNYRWASVAEGCTPLTAASTDFPVAKCIRDVVSDYISGGYCNYGPNDGIPEFRQAYAMWFERKLAAFRRYDSSLATSCGKQHISEGDVMAVNAEAAGVYS